MYTQKYFNHSREDGRQLLEVFGQDLYVRRIEGLSHDPLLPLTGQDLDCWQPVHAPCISRSAHGLVRDVQYSFDASTFTLTTGRSGIYSFASGGCDRLVRGRSLGQTGARRSGRGTLGQILRKFKVLQLTGKTLDKKERRLLAFMFTIRRLCLVFSNRKYFALISSTSHLLC